MRPVNAAAAGALRSLTCGWVTQGVAVRESESTTQALGVKGSHKPAPLRS